MRLEKTPAALIVPTMSDLTPDLTKSEMIIKKCETYIKNNNDKPKTSSSLILMGALTNSQSNKNLPLQVPNFAYKVS